MNPYYLLLLIVLVGAALLTRQRAWASAEEKIVVSFLFVLLVLFAGLRFDSTDYDAYLSLYNIIDFDKFGFPLYDANTGTTGNEFLFASFVSVFKLFGAEFAVFIFAFATVSIGLKFKLILKYSHYPILALCLYLATLFFKDLGQIRNALAAAIVAFSYPYIVNRQITKFGLIIVLASGVQIFSLMAFPIYFLHPLLRNGLVSSVMIMTSVLIFIAGGIAVKLLSTFSGLDSAILSKVIGYATDGEVDAISFNLLNICMILIAFLFIYSKNFFETQNNNITAALTCYIYSVILYFCLADIPILASRAYDLLGMIPIIILLPNMLGIIKPVSFRWLPITMILLYSSLLYYVLSQTAMDYTTIL